MNRSRTHTVESAYVGRDNIPRCYLRDHASVCGHTLPLITDTLLNEGDAVVVVGNRAERPS